MKSTSDIKPNKYTFERYPLGGYILWLREIENMREITETDDMGEPHTSWVYDEYTMLVPTSLTDESIEQHFDEYLAEAKRAEAMKTDKRLVSIESAVTDILRMIGGTTQ